MDEFSKYFWFFFVVDTNFNNNYCRIGVTGVMKPSRKWTVLWQSNRSV